MKKYRLTKKDIENLTMIFSNNTNGLTVAVFAKFPLPLKRHCVQTGAVAGFMVMHAPESAIPDGMTREEYANAVRYGSLYHDIGAYLVYNQRVMYPSSGERFLREQISESEVDPAVRQVILETVRFCCERCDGSGYPDNLTERQIPLHAGICAIADKTDNVMMNRRFGIFNNPLAEAKAAVIENIGKQFLPEAVECFMAAYADISYLYKRWSKSPPFWKHGDIKPLDKKIDQPIG
ncbi:MAG: HD domain-containing protein [Oscillospiraceae bacterium]|nr:HD domain-containing protein [Oscillospiraceae bacterium]